MTGKQQFLCIIGSPVAHSVSPAMHLAAAEHAGLNISYTALEVAPAQLASTVADLRARGTAGFNVTTPHKQAVIPFLDELDDSAAALGAVNTVANSGGRLKGYSTDGGGYVAALAQSGFSPAGKEVFIFGAGGAGRAIIHALHKSGAKAVYYCVRGESSRKGCERMLARTGSVNVSFVKSESAHIARRISGCDLIINATPQGMGGSKCAIIDLIDWNSLKKDALVSDIVYHPLNTPFLQKAKSFGLKTHTGDGMVLHQAALAFEIWFGQKAPLGAMQSALSAALAAGE